MTLADRGGQRRDSIPSRVVPHTLNSLAYLVFGRRRKSREGVQDQIRTVIRRGRQAAAGFDTETFNRRPDGGGWSVGQCLDHLNETALLYLPAFAEAVERARSTGHEARPGSEGRTLLGRLVVWTQEPPPLFRMGTYDAIRPGSDLEPETVLESFEALHEELIVRINEASDLDWRKLKLRSLLDRRLKLSLGDWFHFMAAHARRHLWQAEQVKAEIAAAEGEVA